MLFLRTHLILFIILREEDINGWVTDIKDSDYQSIKEKVMTLEQGLQAIGLAQVSIISVIKLRMPR